MYKHCNTEESARRQRQFEYCLLELMQTIPYSQITIGDICQRVSLSRKSFYRYFGSKDGCLHALIDHCILESSRAYLADSTAVENQRQIFVHYFSYWKQMRPLLEALCQNNLTNCLFERSMLCVTQEELEFRNYLNAGNHDDAYEQMLFMVSGITGLIINWHLTGYKKSASQLAAITDRLLAKSLITDTHQVKKS